MPGLAVGDRLLAPAPGCKLPVFGYSNEQWLTTADRRWFCLRGKRSKFDFSAPRRICRGQNLIDCAALVVSISQLNLKPGVSFLEKEDELAAKWDSVRKVRGWPRGEQGWEILSQQVAAQAAQESTNPNNHSLDVCLCCCRDLHQEL